MGSESLSASTARRAIHKLSLKHHHTKKTPNVTRKAAVISGPKLGQSRDKVETCAEVRTVFDLVDAAKEDRSHPAHY